MSWRCFKLIFQVKSPVHIGFHKVMHFYRTRPYVPGKIIWAALTSKLSLLLNTENYRIVGDFLTKIMRFGYLFPCLLDEKSYSDEKIYNPAYTKNGQNIEPIKNIYYPVYTKNGLKFNSVSVNEFEKKFISSMASAAIEAESLTAEEGMLHEVEFISPFTIDEGKAVFLAGFIWLKEYEGNKIKSQFNKNNELKIIHERTVVTFHSQLANRLQIGGERRYGFGLIELHKFEEISNKNFNLLPGEWNENNGEVYISIDANSPIWAHLKYSNNLRIKGNIEPYVGREWEIEKGAGRNLVSHGLFWSPGSILNEEAKFKIIDNGFWEKL